MKKNRLSNNHPSGYIAFTAVLVISAITMSLVISSVLISVTTAKNLLSAKKGQETLVASNGCLENALLRIKLDSNYSGESLNIGNSSCTISVAGSATQKTINIVTILSGVPSYTRSIQAVVEIEGTGLSLTNYQEVQ